MYSTGIEIVIHAGDIDVVDVEQQAAIGFVGDAGKKFPFGHRGGGEGDVAAGIFQHERPLQKILHGADPIDDMPQCFVVERQREQIVGIHTQHAGPTKMIGNPTGIDFAGQSFQFRQIIEVQRVGAADRQRDAMHDDRVLLGDLLEHVTRSAARIDKVFRNDFEPIDRGLVLENVREMDTA